MSHKILSEPMLARLAQARTVEEALRVALADAIALHGAEMGNVQMVGPCGDLVIVAHTNTAAAFLRRLGHVPAGTGTVCERAALSGGIVYVADLAEDPACAPFVELARTIPFTSVLSSALTTARGVPVGVLSVHSRNRFTPSRLELAAMRDYSVALADRMAEAGGDLRATAHELAKKVQPEFACGCTDS